MKILAFSVITSFVCTLVALRVLLTARFRGLAVDRPNERSLHQAVVPRTGGLAILVGTSAGLGFESASRTLALWGIALGLAAVSFADDRYGLPVSLRFIAQLVTAGVAITFLTIDEPWFVLGVALLAIVWMTNLYNFMDGADGLAGGMGVTGFAAYAIASASHGDFPLTILCASLAAGCAGFLTSNYPPATIFMGDVGSTVLGFLSAAVAFYGYSADIWPLWFPILTFLPFCLDATVTLIKRATRGERVWRAHREHYYQRLIRSGWTHKQTAMVWHTLMAATAAAALVTLDQQESLGWPVLALALIVLGLLMRLTDVRWHRYQRDDNLREQQTGGASQ